VSSETAAITRQEQLMADATPVSYLALRLGVPVRSSSGGQIGTVEHVLQVPEEDLFDGIVLTTDDGLRFVDRDQITEMTTEAVQTSLTDDEAAALPEPHGTKVFHVDALQDVGSGLTARLGRMFNRERWIPDK
jgi:hypothetical protein